MIGIIKNCIIITRNNLPLGSHLIALVTVKLSSQNPPQTYALPTQVIEIYFASKENTGTPLNPKNIAMNTGVHPLVVIPTSHHC